MQTVDRGTSTGKLHWSREGKFSIQCW